MIVEDTAFGSSILVAPQGGRNTSEEITKQQS